MVRPNPRVSARRRRAASTLVECLRYFLTPWVWKQVHQGLRGFRGSRWKAQVLILVLLTSTWCWGDSLAERFETARAFHIASYQRRRRPGKTLEGLHKALRRLPCAGLRLVATAVRRRLQQVFAKRLLVDGFVPLGCDGSTLETPRTPELERRLGKRRRPKVRFNDPPQLSVTALMHLSLGVLWSWRLGTSRGSERDHLIRLLPTVPDAALLVADAGYVGDRLMRVLTARKRSFLLRLSSNACLYGERPGGPSWRDGAVFYWPQQRQRCCQPPLRVRVLRIGNVWLVTNVLDPAKLPLRTASKFYRWRWRNEGLFRTYKRTLRKVKLLSRGVALVHREAEASLLAVQLLLAQGARARTPARPRHWPQPCPRQVLVEIRREMRNVIGMYLGPRQQPSYWERLRRVRPDTRRHRHNKTRRRWPSRVPHRPPKPPRILKMGTDLKEILAQLLPLANAG